MRKVVILSAALLTIGCSNAALADNKTDLADLVYDSTKCYWAQDMVNKLMTFNLSPGIWAKMLDRDGWGKTCTGNSVRDMEQYAKTNGWGDLEEAESANNNDRESNKPRVFEMVDSLKDKLGVTVQADALKGSDAEWDRVHRYWTTLTEFIGSGDWKPKNKAIFLTVIISPTAGDLDVTAAPDGKHFTVKAPSNREPEEWGDNVKKKLQKLSR
jgi:hypothetical protein